MNFVPPPLLSRHRLNRIAMWATLMLAWMAAFMFSATKCAHRTRIRRRSNIRLDTMARMVRHLIIICASQILGRRQARRQPQHPSAPKGFGQRARPYSLVRSLIGSQLRRRLCARDPAKCIGMLTAALRDLDAICRALVKRCAGGLTRLRPIVARRPPEDTAPTLAAPAVFAMDTS